MDWVNTSPLVKTYTLEDFWSLSEPPDHSKVELIGGILYLTPRPDRVHSRLVSKLIRVLCEHRLQKGDDGKLCVPRAGMLSKPNTWLEPDFYYVSPNTAAKLDGEYYTSADLVVEVMAEESAIYDRNTKADTYAALGVKELWLVDERAETIEIRTLEGERYMSGVVLQAKDRLTSTVLSGI